MKSVIIKSDLHCPSYPLRTQREAANLLLKRIMTSRPSFVADTRNSTNKSSFFGRDSSSKGRWHIGELRVACIFHKQPQLCFTSQTYLRRDDLLENRRSTVVDREFVYEKMSLGQRSVGKNTMLIDEETDLESTFPALGVSISPSAYESAETHGDAVMSESYMDGIISTATNEQTRGVPFTFSFAKSIRLWD